MTNVSLYCRDLYCRALYCEALRVGVEKAHGQILGVGRTPPRLCAEAPDLDPDHAPQLSLGQDPHRCMCLLHHRRVELPCAIGLPFSV